MHPTKPFRTSRFDGRGRVKLVGQLSEDGDVTAGSSRCSGIIHSIGTTPPVATPMDITDKPRKKFVPAAGRQVRRPVIGWRERMLSLTIRPSEPCEQKLGLPPGMQVGAYESTRSARQGAVAFESTIARTKVTHSPDTSGGATQTIVVDRTPSSSRR